MNDYVIAFDANGQPYISHAFWNRNKGGQKKEHKYIQRIKDKNGLWRYFYDEEEWQAYLKGKTDHVDSIGVKIKDEVTKMSDSFASYYENEYLAHHGIKGQKWGARRYQNEDGSLTEEGLKRYRSDSASSTQKSLNRIESENARLKYKSAKEKIKAEKAYQKSKDDKYEEHISKAKEYDTAVKSGEKLVSKMVSDATKKGMTVNSKDFVRMATVGETALAHVIAGIPADLIYNGANYYQASKYHQPDASGFVSGKKYSVTRTH